jgi:hypothetical protein
MSASILLTNRLTAVVLVVLATVLGLTRAELARSRCPCGTASTLSVEIV